MRIDWLHIDVTTIVATGERTVTYSHTPEEVVAIMQEQNEHFYVAQGACAECIYVPGSPMPRPMVDAKEGEFLEFHRVPECLCNAVARRQCRYDIPDIYCYGYYYQYWHKNKYLAAMKEVGLVTFYDTKELPGLTESGMELYAPYWEE